MRHGSFDNLLLFLEMIFPFLIAFCLQESNLTTSIHSGHLLELVTVPIASPCVYLALGPWAPLSG